MVAFHRVMLVLYRDTKRSRVPIDLLQMTVYSDIDGAVKPSMGISVDAPVSLWTKTQLAWLLGKKVSAPFFSYHSLFDDSCAAIFLLMSVWVLLSDRLRIFEFQTMHPFPVATSQK